MLKTFLGEKLAVGHGFGGLYRLNTTDFANMALMYAKSEPSLSLWHARLGHLHADAVKLLADQGWVEKMRVGSRQMDGCTGCVLGKQHRESFPKKTERRATELLGIVHSDVCGPLQEASIGGSRYFVTFIDDFSRFTWVYFLKSKSQVFDCFKEFVNMAETSTGGKVKILRSDNGGEYKSKSMSEFRKSRGIVHELTVPYTPEQNGVAERMNRTLVESARSMMSHAKLPVRFWAEAIGTAAYLRNRSPTVAVKGMTPFERWFGRKPSLSQLRIFGCDAYAHIAKEKRRKLDPKSKLCVFVGYGNYVKGYRLYDPALDDVIHARNVVFFEETFSYVRAAGSKKPVQRDPFGGVPGIPLWKPGGEDKPPGGPKPATGNPEINPDDDPGDLGEDGSSSYFSGFGENSFGLESDVESDRTGTGNQSDVESARNGDHSDAESDRNGDKSDAGSDGNVPGNLGNQVDPGAEPEQKPATAGKVFRDPKIDVGNIVEGTRQRKPREPFDAAANMAALTVSASLGEPRHIKDAWNGPDGPHWKEATDNEMKSLIDRGTWKLVPLPTDRKKVGCKWVFKIKRKADGTVDRHKARLVGQGFSQEHGKDYDEVFAPVARGNAIRTVLALANHLDWHIHQMDVKTAFLNGDLDHEIYMSQPPGYIDKKHPDYVCKLQRSLYGMKQSARCWNEKIDAYLRKTGYAANPHDPCVYVKKTKDGTGKTSKMVVLILYVDDILLASADRSLIDQEKASLAKGFEMEDRGEAHFVLGMAIKRDRKKRILTIDQKSYVTAVIDRFGMTDCTPVDTPMEAGKRFDQLKPGEKGADKQTYQAIIGSLTYAMTATRPDLSASVGMLSQFMSNPSQVHMDAAKRVLRYLKRTSDYGLRFESGRGSRLVGYSDADWAGDLVTRRSTSGYVVDFCGGTISWSSKRQSVVAKSSTEAEYMAMAQAASEIVFLRRFIGQFGCDVKEPTVLYADNLSAMALAKNPVFHSRTKHIDVQHHYIRECVDNGWINLVHVSTGEMMADVLTKPLARPKFREFCEKMGVGPV